MKKYYEVVFCVTETCNNGNEKKYMKSVYVPRFDESGRHISPNMQVTSAWQELKRRGYYNIYHVKTICSEIIVVDV